MSAEFLNQLPQRNPRLFAMVCRFNRALAADIHPTRIPDGTSATVWQRLCTSRRGTAMLSAVTTKSIPSGGDSTFHGFDVLRRRLALLNVSQIDRLARYTTAAINRKEISHAVTREQRESVKSSVGDDGYQFAVRKAEQLLGQRIAKCCASTDESTLERPFYCLARCFAGESAALRHRLQMKLPVGVELSLEQPDSGSDVLGETMIRILLHEIAPELKPCFN